MQGQVRWLPFRHWKDEMQVGGGLSNGTLNYPLAIASGFNAEYYLNLVSTKNVSFSVGTNLKIGEEQRGGLGFVDMAAEIYSGDFSDPPSYSSLYAETPLTFRLNAGAGSTSLCGWGGGFYLGGGMTYLWSGYEMSPTDQEAIGFLGYVAEAGIRLAGGIEFGFVYTKAVNSRIGPISSPTFYEFNLTFGPYWRH